MGKWFKNESVEEQGRGPRAPGWRGMERGRGGWREMEEAGGGWMVQEQEESGRLQGPVRMGWMWLSPQGCAERRKGREAGIGAPGAGSQQGAVAGGVWFCFQKHSSGLAATFKRPENMEAGFGEEEHRERQQRMGKC